MKKNKLIAAMALTLSLSLVSCGDDKTEVVSQMAEQTAIKVVAQVSNQASILDYIPAETPILFYYVNNPKNPVPEKFVNKMDKIYSSLGEIFKTTFLDSYKEYMVRANPDADTQEIEIFVEKWFSDEGFAKLGLSVSETEFAMYAVDLFPVMRLKLAKSHSMGEVLDEFMQKINEDQAGIATKRELNGATIYQVGDKEIQAIVSLKDNTLVSSFSPTREVDKLIPTLFGEIKPTKALKQSHNYQDTLSKYNYLGNSLVWIDIRKIADYFINPAQHQSAMLDVMKVEDNILSADCKTEILDIFDKFPRMVSGNRVFDNENLNSHMIFEMEAGLGAKLATMSGRIPAVVGDPSMSYGFSFDIAAAKSLAQEFVSNIEATPYKCEFLSGMNEKASMFKAQLDQPLPPFVGNFKGFNMVIDELDLDLSQTDPSQMVKNIKAKFLLAIDNPEALKGMVEMMMPEVKELGLNVDEAAVNISSMVPVSGTQLPINLDFLFMAMGEETIGLSLGEGTGLSLAEHVSQDSESDFFNFSIKAELYKSIFDGISEMTDQFPEEMKKQFTMQKLMMNDMIWWNSYKGNVNFTDQGFEFNVNYKY